MALVQSVIRKLPYSSYPMGRIHFRTPGCKGSLSNSREGKYKAEHGGAQVESGGQEQASALQMFLRPTLTYGKGRTR
jgi:hypothetical protein